MSKVKITNQYLDDVNWLNGAGCSFDVQNGIDVWRINISSNLPLLDEFQSIMLPDEIARANRYFQLKDKNRYIVSRGVLRIILGKYLNQAPSAVRFGIGVNKKPYIISRIKTPLCYNISHAGDWILLAVANSEIGADIEPVDPDFGYHEILEDNFSTGEISYIEQTSSAERFFLLWTRKEALTKATGKGLDDNLKLIPSLDGVHFAESNSIQSHDNWLVSSLKLCDNYFASVASNVSINKLNFWDIGINLLHNNLI